MIKISRVEYARRYGPTVGDKIRLADTEIFLQIERDDTVYGEEAVLGLSGSIRDAMAQAGGYYSNKWADLVLTNAIIFDRWHIIKADIAIKNGTIAALGKAGNPETQPGVNIVIGPSTEIISAEGKIVTPGGVSCGEKLYSPRAVWEAIRSGITTIAFGGTGPDIGLRGVPTTAGSLNIQRMLQTLDGYPLNTLVIGNASDSGGEGIAQQIRAGAAALMVHEARGASAEAIDTCMRHSDMNDLQSIMRPSTLNESGYINDWIAAAQSRTTLYLGVEGGLGGPVPDSLLVCSIPNFLVASNAATLPYTVDTTTDMVAMAVHGLGLRTDVPGGASLVSSMIRPETLQADQILNDMGAIPIVAPSTLGIGGSDQLISNIWRAAHNMKNQRGRLPEDSQQNDNFRARRYLAKYTSNPARSLGIFDYVGSIEVNKRADLVIWDPAYFGVRPSMVLVGGVTVAADLSLTNTEPSTSWARPQSMAIGASDTAGLAFVSQKSVQDENIQAKYALAKGIAGVKGTRGTSKANMDLNTASPSIVIDPETYEVRADGSLLNCAPTTATALTRIYSLY